MTNKGRGSEDWVKRFKGADLEGGRKGGGARSRAREGEGVILEGL
jgi:hypothetical protein